MEVKQILTTQYHANANNVERHHRTLGHYLRAYTEREQSNWHKYLKFATFTYNNTVNSATGFAPNELVLGHMIELPLKLEKGRLVQLRVLPTGIARAIPQ